MVNRSLKSHHNAIVMSPEWANRLARGQTESSPSDYKGSTEEQKRERHARAALEDRALMRELGLTYNHTNKHGTGPHDVATAVGVRAPRHRGDSTFVHAGGVDGLPRGGQP